MEKVSNLRMINKENYPRLSDLEKPGFAML